MGSRASQVVVRVLDPRRGYVVGLLAFLFAWSAYVVPRLGVAFGLPAGATRAAAAALFGPLGVATLGYVAYLRRTLYRLRVETGPAGVVVHGVLAYPRDRLVDVAVDGRRVAFVAASGHGPGLVVAASTAKAARELAEALDLGPHRSALRLRASVVRPWLRRSLLAACVALSLCALAWALIPEIGHAQCAPRRRRAARPGPPSCAREFRARR